MAPVINYGDIQALAQHSPPTLSRSSASPRELVLQSQNKNTQGPHGSPSKGLPLATLYTHHKLNTALPCRCLLSSLAALKHFPWPWKGNARQNYSLLKPHPQGQGTADPLQTWLLAWALYPLWKSRGSQRGWGQGEAWKHLVATNQGWLPLGPLTKADLLHELVGTKHYRMGWEGTCFCGLPQI